ncbi:MAG TPA: hypothetical protein DCL77_14425 [Prolixibacteraceae bacterium]|jgi:hypothetical protein|nr:hypothetical protein [Prolixibacteraceae bacterium]
MRLKTAAPKKSRSMAKKEVLKKKDIYTKDWIIAKSVPIIARYEAGILTIRGLHYQLVAIGMLNTMRHYKRVVNAMIIARRAGVVAYSSFSDHDRDMLGYTDSSATDVDAKISQAKGQLRAWMNTYSKNRWENQPWYPEVFIEKKALQGVFQSPCSSADVALGACKGYPSLTFLYDASKRFISARNEGKKCVIIYFGDYDPSGEDIPRSIEENMLEFGCKDILIHRVALNEKQVIEWDLPYAPVKEGDSRSANWKGLGQVELDAVEPTKLQGLCRDAIGKFFDQDLYDELKDREEEEGETYRKQLRYFVDNNL